MLPCVQRGVGAAERSQLDLPMAQVLAPLQFAARLTQLNLCMQARMSSDASLKAKHSASAEASIYW